MDENEPTKRDGVPRRLATADLGVKPPKSPAAGSGHADSLPVAEASPPALPDAGARIASLWPGILEVRCPSGTRYRWDAAGQVRQVAAEDVAYVFGRNRSTGRACCGGSTGRTYFATAD